MIKMQIAGKNEKLTQNETKNKNCQLIIDLGHLKTLAKLFQ
jgi:hypothetical protein